MSKGIRCAHYGSNDTILLEALVNRQAARYSGCAYTQANGLSLFFFKPAQD
ncbi:MAG: hypothetical protein ACFCU1_12155 [Sumerlaeia bacterium]